jgi:hypothetical protein
VFFAFMPKKAEAQQNELELVTIEDFVPVGYLLRKIAAGVDFGFVREPVEHLQCSGKGRPGLDPLVLFKPLLLGHLYGIRSERQLGGGGEYTVFRRSCPVEGCRDLLQCFRSLQITPSTSADCKPKNESGAA